MADTPNNAPASPAAPAQSQEQSASNSSAAPATDQAAALEAVATDPNAPKAIKVAAAKKLKSLRIKVDGQEFEENLPFELDENNKEAIEYMRKQLQFSKVSQKRMGEKAQLEGEVRQFLDNLKANPKKTLSDPMFGIDLKKLAAQMIEEEIANAAKSPEQLRAEKLEQELKDIKEQRQKEQKDHEERESQRLTEMEYERYDSLMSTAIEKSDLPKSPYVVKKMADLIMIGLREGLDVTPDDVLPLVREEILEDIRQMAQAMPLETIEKLFGGDILSKIRKKNVAKAKSQPQSASPKLPDVGATRAEPKKDDDKTKKKSYKEFFGV